MDIRLTEAGQLSLKFDGHRALVDLPKSTGKCHSLVLSAFMVKDRGRTTYRKGDSILNLYWDGVLIYEKEYRNRTYADAAPSTPLRTYSHPEQAMIAVPGVAPYISTRKLPSEEILTRLHPKLQGLCNAQTL